jgi:hypothetical protein
MKRLPLVVLLLTLAALIFPATGMAAVGSAKWTQVKTKGAAPSARSDSGLASTNSNTVFLFGGESDGSALDDLWKLDVKKKRWTKLSPAGAAPAARFGHTFVRDADGTLLLFGGESEAGFFNDTWRYTPATNTWTPVTVTEPAPAARYGHGTAYDPKARSLWVTHGFTDSGRFDDTWSLTGGTWSDGSPAAGGARPLERCLVGSAFHDGSVFLFGGQSNPTPFLRDLWRYDTATKQWTELKPKTRPAARNLYGSAQVGADWLIHGGNGTGGPLGDLWALDLDKQSLARVRVSGKKPAARFGGELAPLGSKRALLFGGASLDGEFKDVWVAALRR